jgi:hypothetical protein
LHGLRPLVPAGHAPGLRTGALLVRSLLIDPQQRCSNDRLPRPNNPTPKEDLMRKFTVTLAAVFVLATAGLANAQNQGASGLNTQAQNATIIHKAACNGFWGRWCPPGRHRVCGPWRCWCAPCW